MGEKDSEDSAERLDPDVTAAIERVSTTYAAAEESFEEMAEQTGLESYLSRDVQTITNQLIRAREWEHKLEAARSGLLSPMQVTEQIEDGPFEIEAEVNRAIRYVDGLVDDLQTVNEQFGDDAELESALSDLLDELHTQRQALTALKEMIDDVHNSIKDSGIRW
jgi:hypothetical protein